MTLVVAWHFLMFCSGMEPEIGPFTSFAECERARIEASERLGTVCPVLSCFETPQNVEALSRKKGKR